MEKLSAAKTSTTTSPQMAGIINWLERYICGVRIWQQVVGRRDDGFGGKVTQLMFDNKSRLAHICPFVRDALDFDLFWIEESPLTEDKDAIAQLLRSQITEFKNSAPTYDPLATGKPAEFPTLWKTFFTFFPDILRIPGDYPVFDQLHEKLKPEFVRAGLMLGQFYPGCSTPGIHNTEWTGSLVAPYPSFAVRYMAKHDHLFISEGSPEYQDYSKFFRNPRTT